MSVLVATVGTIPTPAPAFDQPISSAPADSDARILFGEVTGAPPSFGVDGFGQAVEISDVNDDGADDVLVMQGNGETDGLISVYLGSPGTGFTQTDERVSANLVGEAGVTAPGPEITITGGGLAGQFVVADFDGTGSLEIAAVNGAADVVIFTVPTAPGDYELGIDLTPTQTVDGPGFPSALAIGDFDTDPATDDLAIGYSSPGQVDIHFGGSLAGSPTADVVITGPGGSSFGSALAAGPVIGIGGIDDLIIGAQLEDVGSGFSGRVYGFDQPGLGDGALNTVDDVAFDAQTDEGNGIDPDLFGNAVAVGDVVGGPEVDLVIGAPGLDGGDGAVYTIEGPLTPGASLPSPAIDRWSPSQSGVELGQELEIDDINADGLDDVIAGATDAVFVWEHDAPAGPAGSSERAFEGWRFDGGVGSDFGRSLAITGNFPAFLAVGAPSTQTNVVEVTDNAGAVELFDVSFFGGRIFEVNSTADVGEDVIDGFCDDGAGNCTLRAAIQEANFVGAATIRFEIPGGNPQVIDVPTPLPVITSTVRLLGGTQSGSGGGPFGATGPVIGLRSTIPTPNTANGLHFGPGSDDSDVFGLGISGFGGSAVYVEADRVRIAENRLGLRPGDANDSNPNAAGVTVAATADNTRIRQNVISNNSNVGVDNLGNQTLIEINRIGTDRTGTSPRPNRLGINHAGGQVFIIDNVISGNDEWGIQVKQGSTTILRNLIGTAFGDPTFTNISLGNGLGGVLASAATTDDQIVFSFGSEGSDAQANTVGFNGGPGISAVGVSDGAGITQSTVVTRVDNNVIVGNTGPGISLNLGYARISGNRIGITDDGAVIPNTEGGIATLSGEYESLEGRIGPGNTIRGNGGPGILLEGDSSLSAVEVGITENSIDDNTGLGIELFIDNALTTPAIGSISRFDDGVATGYDIDVDVDVPAGEHRVELFASEVCDPSGFGEGLTFVDSILFASTGGPSTFGFSVEDFELDGGEFVTATVSRISEFDPPTPVQLGDPTSTSEFSACSSIFDVTTDAEVDSVTIAVDSPSTGPGVTSIPISDIPIEAVLEATNDAGTEAAPLGAVPLTAVSLAASPLGAVPLTAVDLSSLPLGAVPLGAVPVDFPGGWPALLVGTPFEGQIPQAITLQEALDAAPEGSDLAALPLGAVDLSDTPLGALPLSAVVLGSIDIGAAPLSAVPLSAVDLSVAPLGAVPLTAVPLTAVPLTAVPLGAVPLTAVDFSSVPLGAVPLGAVPLTAVPLTAVEIGGTPLTAVDLAQVPLTAVPLTAVALAGTPLGAVTLAEISTGGQTGCEILAGSAVDCDDAAIDSTTTLVELASALEGAGSSLDATPLGAVPLTAVPLGAVPLTAVPLGAVDLELVPLGAVPLTAVDIQGTPLGAVPLTAVTFNGSTGCELLAGSSPDCLELGLDDNTTLFELAVALERSGSSLAASPLGAVPLTAVPLTAVEVDGQSIDTLADLFGEGDIADLPQEVLDALTVADILAALVITSDYPWEELDFVDLGIQDYVDNATEITYTATVDVTGDGTVVVSATLPPEYRYRSGSTMLLNEFAEGDFLDPIIDDASTGQVLTWFIPASNGTNDLDFKVSPGFTLGTSGVSIEASGANETSSQQINAAPHTITAPTDPTTTSEDTLQLGWLTVPAETDIYEITAPDAGFTTSVFLNHFSEDTDLVLYRPTTAPPAGGGGETADAPTTQVIEDDGFGRIDAAEPESLGDSLSTPDQSIVESSTGRGIADEQATDYRSETATAYSIQVNGYNGATSAEPYILRVKFTEDAPIPACPATGFSEINAATTAALPAGLETIIVFDQGRMEAIYGATEAGQVLTAAQSLATFLNASDDFGDAAILFTDDLTSYGDWDSNPCDWQEADAIAKDIRAELVDYAVANESLRYITILGDDDVIPFHRQVDATSYANEDSFAAEFSDNALFGSLSTRHILTDHPYGDPDPIPWLDRFLYLPEIAVGRLLETPAEITTAIDTFVNFDGQLDPAATALVTGYDFLIDGATDTAAALTDNGITTESIINDTWTDDLLEAALLVPNGPDLVSANAHFDYYRALPASENLADPSTYGPLTLFQADEVLDELDNNPAFSLEGNWLFTMGCHAGLSVSDVAIGSSPDWAQTWAGNGGILTGNTGFGYGDTVTVALTEELVVGLADGLDGSLTIGQATVNSLQNYYARAGLYGVYDEKVIQQFTTYGLPMYQVGGDGAAPADPPEPTVSTDPFTGQPSATVTESVAVTSIGTDKGTLYSVDGQTLEIHYRPIQPMTSIDVTVDGLVARGAIITDWTSTDVTETDIAYSRPVIDDGNAEPEIENPNSVFPSTFAAVANFERPSTEPGTRTERRQNLNLIVGQYNAPLQRQRLFDDIEVDVLYVDPASPLADDDTPAVIEQVQASIINGTVGFIVDVADETPAARVALLYRSDTPGAIWRKAELVSGSPWSGGGPVETGTTEVEYIVQVARENGLVSVSSSKGSFHQAVDAPAPPATPALTVDLDGSIPGGTWYTGPVTVNLTGSGGPFTVTVDGETVDASTGSFIISEDGVHQVVVTGTNGVPQTFGVPIDQTSPEVSITGVPPIIFQGETVVVDYDCRDAGSGIVNNSCSGTVLDGSVLDTSTLGPGSITVTARDIAGNPVTTESLSYDVVPVEVIEVALAIDPEVTSVGNGVTATVTSDGATPIGVEFSWGDGTASTTTGASATHVYFLPGLYDLIATVEFEDGRTSVVTGSVVVFDPTGSYIAGNGKIDVPAGTFLLDPDASGRVDVKFNPKYKNGVLKGKIEVKGKDIDLEIKTDDLEWMFVAGAVGTVQGTGWLQFEVDGEAYERFVTVRVVAAVGDELADDTFDEDAVSVRISDPETGDVLFDTGGLLEISKGKLRIKD